jgi:3-oxoacyl-[acyl-carrier protein] reductase
MKTYDLTDHLVVITGASRGIGLHTARAFHQAGCRLVVTARHKNTLDNAVKDIGSHCAAYVCDQRDTDAVQDFANHVLKDHGPPDILIPNAAAFGGGPVQSLSLDTWRDVIETNLTGVFVTVQSFLPAMIEKNRGDIFIISSMSGKRGDPTAAAYAASKFGLQGFAQCLNHDVRRHNIRVMVLNPSSVNTEPTDTSPLDGPRQKLHAADLATLMVNLAQLPGRTLVRDLDIWATNPF